MAEAANIKVVISAITEAAQQAIDEVGDDISGIADDAAIGQTALDQLSDELGETASRAAVTQAALDELQDEERDATIATHLLKSAQEDLGDELTQNTAKSTAAAGAFSALSLSSEGTSLSFGILSSTTTLTLIPALLTLSTVLAPLVVTLGALAAGAGALAAAFGLVVGSGILAFGQKRAEQNKEELQQIQQRIAFYENLREQNGALTDAQKEQLQSLKDQKDELEDATTATGALGQVVGDLKEEITPLIVEFGEEFVPLIEDAVDAIPTLVRRMLGAVGGTDEFRMALRDFGAIMMDVLPALTGLVFDLARAALPVFRDFVNFLLGNGGTALDDMKASVQELAPEMNNLLDALIDAAPTLLKFGTNVGEVVLPALTDLIRAADGFMEAVNGMPEGLQNVVIAGLILLPLLVKFGGILSALIPSAYTLGVAFGLVEQAVAAVAGVVSGSLAAAAALGAAIGLVAVKALDMLGAFDIIGDGAAALQGIVGEDLIDTFLTLMTIMTGGVFPLLAALGGLILGLVRGDLQGGIDNAKQILGEFADAFFNVGDMIMGAFEYIAGIFMDFIGNSILIDLLLSGLKTMFNLFITFFVKTLPSVVFGFLSDMVDGFVSFFTQTLPQVAAQGLGIFVAFLEQQFNRVFNVVADIWNALVEFVASATEELINAGIDAINSFLSTLDSVADKVNEIPGVSGVEVGTLDRVGIDRDIGQVDRRETDFGTLREQRTQQAQTVVQGGVNVNVDGDDFGRNPREDSRTFADQLRRELRNDRGSNS